MKNKEKLNAFFEQQIEVCTHCEETGLEIFYPTRSNIAHILPKSQHPSVSTVPYNCIHLTLQKHTEFDNLLFRHKFEQIEKFFPNSFEIIWKRTKKCLDLAQENTALSRALRKYLDYYE